MAASPRQLAIYDFIAAYRKAYGCAPTLREIAAELGIALTTVYYHLECMEAVGMIRRDRFARAIVLLRRVSNE